MRKKEDHEVKKWISTFLFAFLLAGGIAAANVDASAATVTGWKQVNGHWYYYTAKGKTTGWLLSGGKWYYFDSTGMMKTGWVALGGKWYYFDTTGAMKTGWVSVGGKWYYLNSDGSMATGWKNVSGVWYYLDASGVMKTGWFKQGNTTYYLLPSGAMAKGWQTIGGKQYYFTSSGAMAINTIVDGKKLGSDGAVVPNTPATPVEQAINDAAAFGATVKAQSDGTYNIYKNDVYIGDFDPIEGYIEGSNQFTTLLETLALDLGFHANAQELKSLVDQVQSKHVYNDGVIDDGKTLSIYWAPKVPAPNAAVSKALQDIASSGAIANPGDEGSYNIFKNNEYIGYFNQSSDTHAVEGNGQYANLLETIAVDLGYNSTTAELSSTVQQVMNGTLENEDIAYDGYSLSIYW